MSLPHQFTLALRHLTPGRVLDGVAALPLPWLASGRPDFTALAALLTNAYAAGLTPAVNTFAGSVDLLSEDERQDVLTTAAGVARGRRFFAGALPQPGPGAIATRYARAVEHIARQGGTALLLQVEDLVQQDDDRIVETYRVASSTNRGTVAVEVGRALPGAGRLYSLDLFHRLIDVPQLAGLVHTSLDRVQEWFRIEARDVRRPEFRIYSGNELAADMVSYGSDYLLGVSGVVPDAFALRDRFWRAGDPRGFAVNDVIQYLGCLLYRSPIAASRHSALQFLQARGVIADARPHPAADRRAAADVPMLHDIAARLDALLATHREPASAVRVAMAGGY
jgi:dihydrodipicolinate synthase/N-acetylneuraminate lyase